MTEKTYQVREVARAIWGSGTHAGKAAIVVHFSGCNLWSGKHEERQEAMERSQAVCPGYCDAHFIGGTDVSLEELVGWVHRAWKNNLETIPLVVLTGGEPALQVDNALVRSLRSVSKVVAIETNGTVGLAFNPDLAWVICSPKVIAERVKLTATEIDELRVIHPGQNPMNYRHLSRNRFVQACSQGDLNNIRRNSDLCLLFVTREPSWRLATREQGVEGLMVRSG